MVCGFPALQRHVMQPARDVTATGHSCSCSACWSAAAAWRLSGALLLIAVLLLLRLPSASSSQAENACWTTFAYALRVDIWQQQSREGDALACPSGCLLTLNASNPAAPQLWGSFPYGTSSSVCLAAIHAGVITNSSGGVVLSSRFYRQTWADDSTQTVFPFQSHRGSVSNGVSSQDVPAEQRRTPADRFTWSASVRAAVGPYIAQRRSAPFSPRASHLHTSVLLSFFNRDLYSYPPFVADIIIGGWNGSHYLNDVWIATRNTVDRSEEDWSWTRYPDAPFTPRCDLLSWIDESEFLYSARNLFRLYVIAGQTGHRCGLHELGSCSNEVWIATLRSDLDVPMLIQLNWTHSDPATVARLPFAPRCGAALIGFTPLRPDQETKSVVPHSQLVAIVGGQLSYADAACTAAPVVVNDAWYTVGSPDRSGWRLGPAAPFSPRRSMAHDAAFVHLIRLSSMGDVRETSLPSFTLVGGVRYTGLRWDAALNRSVLTAAELMADVYECVMPERHTVLDNSTACAWNGHNSSEAGPPWAADSTPLPVSDAASLRDNGGLGGVRIGGRTSRAAIADWLATPPVLVDDGLDVNTTEIALNISVIVSPYFGRPAQSLQDVMTARRNLSLLYSLDEAELNDPQSPFNLGSDWLVSHWQADIKWMPLLPQVSAVHYQPWAWTDSPVNASWYAPQAASALNTTRPLLNFRLRRHGHGMSLRSYWTLWGWSMISGGRSGEQYNNDWIRMSTARCARPDDALYRAALGPVSLLRMISPTDTSERRDAQLVSGSARVVCADGFHWEPPVRETQLSLYCAPNGMWTDLDALTVRRCVRSSLNCSFPEVDLGFDACEEPVPVISSIGLIGEGVYDVSVLLRVDNVTLRDIPIGLGTLLVQGEYFSLPLRVMVGGYECALPQLWTTDGGEPTQLCEQLRDGQACEQYAPELHCTLPAVYGINLPITVYSGYRSEMAEVADGALPTVSSTPPRISAIRSTHCNASLFVGRNTQSLLECPNDCSFNVSVQFFTFSTVVGRPVVVRLLTDAALNCSDRQVVGFDGTAIQTEEVVCVVPPRVGSNLPLRLSQLQESREAITLSFRPCQAGYETNVPAVFNDSAGNPCLACPIGYSTQGAVGLSHCEPCPPGSFVNTSGQAACQPCSAGFFMALANASQCWPCSVNSWSRFAGRTDCDSCDMNRYIRYTLSGVGSDGDAAPGNVSDAACEECPILARCSNDGNISALTGGYLLLDQQRGLVSSIVCPSSACVSALGDDQLQPRSACMPAGPRLLSPSSLAVINCCASGRYAAYEPEAAALASTRGSNVLCALCLPGYSEVNGRCIPCDSARWGAVFGLLLLSLLLVYLLHRLPHDFSGSASLVIGAYFLQVSARFLSSEAMPQVLTIINLSLDWDSRSAGVSSQLTAAQAEQQHDFYVGVCILPLTAAGKVRVRLLSPLVALAMLGMVGALQAAASAAIRMRPSPAAWKLYHRLFVPSALLDAPSEQQPAAATSPQHSSAELDQKETLILEPAAASRTQPQPQLQSDSLRMYQRTLVRIALLSYSSLSLLSLSFFRTQPVGEFGRRLVEYPELSPESAEYRLLMPVMVLLLVLVVVGLPALLSAFLLHAMRRSEVQRVKEMALAGQERQMTARQALLLQLCAMHRLQQSWQCVLLLVRRLLLVLLLVLVSDASVWVWLTTLNFCFLALHLHCQPYERGVDNSLETLSLLSLSLQTALLSLWPPPYMSQWLYSALCTLDVAPLLPLLIAAAVQGWRRWRASKLSPAANGVNAALLSEDEQRDAEL